MQNLLTCSEHSSIHGVQHFVWAGKRKYIFRVLWASIFVALTLTLTFFQLKLFYEIVVNKPTTVERYYERADSLNFPNVVICDMNQEYDNFDHLAATGLGNITNLIMLTTQLSLNLLYEPIRLKLRQNITKVLEEFPLLSQQYVQGYSQADPNWMEFLSSIYCSAKS